MGAGPHQVEVQLVAVHLGEEVAAAGKVFQVEELVFFQAMHGLYVALARVCGWRDAHMLAVARGFGESALNSPPLSACQTKSRKEIP